MNGISMIDRRPPRPSSVAIADAPTLEHLLGDGPFLRVVRTICPPGLRLEGEIDLCSQGLLAAALHQAVQFDSGDLHVDLTGVTFIDVGGIRTMTTAAKTLSRDGRRLLLHATPSETRKVIHLLGWETTPGLMHCVGAMP
ncbi:STAS domain-containing protein [Streptomyces hokutonensis]|uniref:STAS domain-containing protein n=1 Tax=Streptomyces hokutonensis TaxID=1306990 RepID=UPI0033CD255E